MSKKTVVDGALRNEVQERARFYTEWGNGLFGTQFRCPEVGFMAKGSVAGKAIFEAWRIELNAVLLVENRSDFLTQTVGHEIAHLMIQAVHGRRVRPHGKEWKSLMIDFGLVPRATHCYDVSRVRIDRSPYIYRCRCDDEVALGVVRHRRIERGAVYYCRRCRSALSFCYRKSGA